MLAADVAVAEASRFLGSGLDVSLGQLDRLIA